MSSISGTNIAENLDKMLATWKTEAVMDTPEDTGETKNAKDENGEDKETEKVVRAARQVSQGGSYYTIDKNIGLITVTAPRPILEKVDAYFQHLKESLFSQVSIEAKI